MKLPREISGEELAKLLKKYDYAITRQTGSHIRLTTILHAANTTSLSPRTNTLKSEH